MVTIEYRCGTCRNRELVIRPVAPGSSVHPNCFHMWCGNGHQLVGVPEEFTISDPRHTLEYRQRRKRR